MKKHKCKFEKGRSKVLKVCVCGKFKFNDNVNAIVAVEAKSA